jgi:hypothetical protein
MKALKLLLFFVILLVTVSCATTLSPQSRSEYSEGNDMAWEYAKKDAMDSNCSGYGYPTIGMFRWFPRRFNVARQEQKHIKSLQEQGRSEAFIKGFYIGYENYYYDFIDMYCGL